MLVSNRGDLLCRPRPQRHPATRTPGRASVRCARSVVSPRMSVATDDVSRSSARKRFSATRTTYRAQAGYSLASTSAASSVVMPHCRALNSRQDMSLLRSGTRVDRVDDRARTSSCVRGGDYGCGVGRACRRSRDSSNPNSVGFGERRHERDGWRIRATLAGGADSKKSATVRAPGSQTPRAASPT